MIDLLFISKYENEIRWNKGNSIFLGERLNVEVIYNKLRHCNNNFIFFVNIDLIQLPSEESLEELVSTKNFDVLHLGLKMGLEGKPDILKYIQPSWIYSLDASNAITSTSWKVSLDCWLIKKDLLINGPRIHNGYDSTLMTGLDWGYRLIKNGAIIKYTPDLAVPKKLNNRSISVSDEFRFVRRNFSSKWYWWSLYRYSFSNKTFFPGISSLKIFISNKRILKDPFYLHNIENKWKAIQKKKKTVAVFTPTLYRYEYLKKELRQLDNQTIKPDEVFITDQTDKDHQEVSWLSDFKELNIIYQPQTTKGQCYAWNYCLKNAKSDYFLFLGDDADDIQPDFIESLMNTLQRYNADLVACNIKERDNESYPFDQPGIFISDIFPICLVKREVFEKIGGYDYAYNKGIRADGDIAIRMHLNGMLLLLDPNIKIYHYRAPVGGLRQYKERSTTRSMSKKNMSVFQLPSITEFYLIKRHFSILSQKEMISIKKFALWSVSGNIFKKAIKFLIYLFRKREIDSQIRTRERKAERMLEEYPQIPSIPNKKITKTISS